MWDRTNAPIYRTAVGLNSSSSDPLTGASQPHTWNDGTKVHHVGDFAFDGSVTYASISKAHADSPITGTIHDSVVFLDSTAGVITYTLPAPAAVGAGWQVTVTDVGNAANAITVARHASEKINFVAGNYSLAQAASKTFITNGTDWFLK